MTRKKAITKVDAGEASFSEWFEAQYGKRPELSDISALEEAVEQVEASAGRLRFRLSCLKRWQDARDVALKAWSARLGQQIGWKSNEGVK